MYDPMNRLYFDAIVQPGRQENEVRALIDMVDRSRIQGEIIITADRGYECYNVFAHIEQKGWKYMIRVKDITSNGILSALELPESAEFDVDVNVVLTRKQTNEVKNHPEIYKIIMKDTAFDFLDLHDNKFYPISFRVIRIKITDSTYECIITNLPRQLFTPQDIKYLYHLRWGIMRLAG